MCTLHLMFCVHCEHCQQAQQLARLRLPRADSRNFYVEFAEVYRVARALSRQPAKVIRDANPGLTPERVKWYRRRCVELGLLDRVREAAPAVQAAVQAVAAQDSPTVELPVGLSMAMQNGVKVTPELIRATTMHKAPGAVQEYLDQLVAAGLVPAPASAS